MKNKSRNNLKEYISLSDKTSKKQNKEYYLFGTILTYVKDDFLVDLDLDSVLRRVEKLVPRTLIDNNLDAIYIGEFESLLAKGEHTALYSDGAIYVSNDQADEQDVFRDLIHEIAHAIEETHRAEIFSDRTIENEFLSKRQMLYSLLVADGHEASLPLFLNVDFSERMDNFLYRELGYPTLTSYSMGLFVNPYAVTDVREYYARGFEEYIYGDKKYLKKISPSLYNILDKILGG
tara:strand:+ start:757 stop:1458 length:702 start_codon:yes stop_codon:yes gene_type:complete